MCDTQCGSWQGPVNYLFKHSFGLSKKRKEKKLLISYTMNKLIKRLFHTHTFFFFFFPPFSSFPQKSKIRLSRKKAKNVRVHRHTTTTKKRGREKEDEQAMMCLTGSQNIQRGIRARRPARAPLRARAAIISAGDGELKWHTNFSKTSSEKSTPLPSWQTPPN